MRRLPWGRRMAAVASLGDDKRRQLFELIASADGAVGRDEAAVALGLPRSTASFHLDRLVQDGLLAVEFHKAAGKSGPGSGRPAKMYRPAANEVGASVPDRNYDLAGDLLAAAVEHSTATGEPVADSLRTTSYRKGQELAAGATGLAEFLAGEGYQPRPDGDGGLVLDNCPFHRLADGHPDVVCAMNGSFLQGAATACGEPEGRIASNSVPGQCCARITPP
ncbi:metalloregulator ArsR/SmtB family transcription factor [Pseudarthrobacter sp. BIM B-2242]|uniref:helix-turn-helix transcriptional regulator n=1 Tax=Pseudarthrobacter sp. BIM B-2242 TaxID=2772401 RepID=UPI00168B6CCB|nr:helix-turn-helix domain-containing protein [Pseudarthrobacter sp. BIM B-2242]QOD02230.1 helix-turn-helix domain-containing protein [Pseudarthrobacter sp. BIM B-2242]